MTPRSTNRTATTDAHIRKAASRRRHARRRQPRLSRLLAWLLSMALGTAGLAYAQVPASALPSGGKVVVGSGQLVQSPNLLIVKQATPRLGLDWQSFNIGSGATVEFRQPSSSSVALNRVVGHSGTEIYGQLRSNGQVFLTNPHGVLFAPGSKVDVGGLVASTLDLSQQDFADGRYVFNAAGGNGAVVNQGTLRASAGGYLALFGQHVDNQGEVSVDAGAVMLASGRAATVSISGSGLISAVVTPGEAGSVLNSGSIAADGGTVTLNARSAQDIASSLVNNSGIVRANTLVERAGEIWITGDQVSSTGRISADAPGTGDAGRVTVKGDMARGSLQVGGSISAQAESGRGGQVETSAAHVVIGEDTRVNTLSSAGTHGTWLIDPTDFTIASGTAGLTTSGIGATTLGNNLNLGNVSLATADAGSEAGDIFVSAPVSWTADTIFTLTAHRNILVNQSITGTGSKAGLVLTPGSAGAYTLGTGAKITLPGGGSSLRIAGVNYTLLRTIDDVQAINTSTTTRSGTYAVVNDIDASATSTWNAGAGFLPIGNSITFTSNNSFRGRFDGLGHSITGLTINRPTLAHVGLFGVVHDGLGDTGAPRDTFVGNITLAGANITGRQYVGALAGYVANRTTGSNAVLITNAHSSGTVASATGSGSVQTGGLVGQFSNTSGLISRSSSSAAVSTTDNAGNIGGLVGYVSAGSIANSSASGDITTTSAVDSRSMGGLVGYFDGTGTLRDSQASGDVTGAYNAGGLVGYYGSSGVTSGVQASGNVTGTNFSGGLFGQWYQAGDISLASTSGTVTGQEYVGGLIGYGYNTSTAGGSILGATSSSSVSGTGRVGGLVGYLYRASIGPMPSTTGGAPTLSAATGTVTGLVNSTNSNTIYAGGLVGQYNTNLGDDSITFASASGAVSSTAPYGYLGGLMGLHQGGSILDSSASGQVLASNAINSRYVGGLVAYFDGAGALTRVNATGQVSGGYYAGGLIGYHGSTGLLSFGTASGNVTGTQYVGGLIGQAANSGAVTDSSASGHVNTAWDGGGLIGYMNNTGGIADSRATGDVIGSGASAGLGGLVGYAYNNGSINNSSASGDVTGASSLGGLVGNLQYTNLNLATATGKVTAFGNTTLNAGGLVGYFYHPTAGAGITNSTASGHVYADGTSSYAGGLVGQMDAGSISNSAATGNATALNTASATSSGHYAGGLVGSFNGTSISDSSATGTVVGRYYSGGLAGYYYGPTGLRNVSASGSVSGTQYVGGLVGYLYYSGVTNGTASGNVASTSDGYVGGLVGYAYSYSTSTPSPISDSRASGTVSGGYYSGGLVGYYDEYFTSTTSGISFSSATGQVSASNTAGGLVGYYSASGSSSTSGIRSSSAAGNVDAPAAAGGLVGRFQAYGGIQDSFATGNVVGNSTTGAQYLGGLVGYYLNSSGTAGVGLLERSYASGHVSLAPGATLSTFSDSYGGGLVGYLDGPSATSVVARNNYATGSVNLTASTGHLRAGGLLGFTDSSIANNYSTGAVSATGSVSSRRVGGLVGQSGATTATATSSYWATDSSGVATSAMGTASTLSAMRNAATFSGWDMASTGGTTQVWRIYEGQTNPLLRGLLTPLTLSLADISKVYDGTTALGSATISVGGIAVTHPDRIFVAGVSANAGTYGLTGSNVYSVQNGYDLSLTGTANLTISRRPLTLAGLVQDKVYDGTTAASLSATPLFGGLVAGEDLAFVPGTGFSVQFATKAAGLDKTVNISGGYSLANGTVGLASNYIAPSVTTTTADITPKELTAGTFTATNRVYDGTTTIAVSAVGSTLGGVVAGDSVTVDLAGVTSGTVANKNVGTAKPVTVSGLSLTGADAGNYTVAGIDGVTVDITPKTLTLNGINATDRPYNTGTAVSLTTSSVSLAGLVPGDTVLPLYSSLRGNTADKNVGSGKAVTITGLALRGPDALNYTPAAGAVSVNITPYLLTLYLGTTSTTNRIYDGTTTANVYFPTYWYGGDDITVSTTSIGYDNKNVAYTTGGAVTSKTITASGISISGADKDNYALQNTTATTTGVISPKPLSVSGVTAVNRVYDGTRDVTVNISGATVDTSAVISGDVVSVATPGTGSVTGQVANKNVGVDKAVTVPGLALTGTDAGNYTITSGTGGGVTVDITRKDVTAVYTGTSKVYDGNPYAVFTTTTSDFIAGDVVRFYTDPSWCGTPCVYGRYTESGRDASGGYVESRHVGTAKPVVITFNGLWSTDAANYNLLNPTGATTADITPKPVTLAFSGVSKVYDGTTAATVGLNFGASGLYSGDTLTSTQTAAYTGTGAKNVGTSKPISVSDIVLSGAHAGNYTVGNTTATTTGTVTAKPITVSGITATDRAYDGSTSVAVTAGTVGSSGFVVGDTVSITLPPGGLTTGTIANKNIGIDKPVTVTGLTLSGTDAPNYSIDASGSGITVDITPAALTPSYAGASRVYNGGVTASVTSTTAGIVSGDVVTFNQTAVYTGADARDVGTAKPVSVSGISISGSGAANYALASTTATTTADITPKPVTPTYVGASRVYNGMADVSASVIGTSLQFVAGDTVGLTETARFTGDGGAGTDKPVSVTGITLSGRHAANYSLLSTSTTTTASITPRPLGVTGISATNRVYDGTTTVAVNVAGATVDTSSVIAGDVVSVSLPPSGISTGDMADRHAGNNKPVSITGLTIGGSSAANYALIGATGLTVNIAPRSLTASYLGVNKVYDGNADAVVTGTSADILGVDASSLGFSATGLFTAGKNAGTGKAVDVISAFLTGASRDNYVLVNTTGTTTADITPRTITANYGGGTRVYDGTTAAPVSATLSGRIAGDAVTTTQTAEFTGTGARNVGVGKAISVSGIALAGTDKDNYVLATTTDTTTGSITPKPITVSGLSSVIATDRVYDGSRIVSVTVPGGVTLVPDSSDIVAGDTVTIAVPGSGVTTGSVANKNVGTGKAVTVDGLTLSGTDAANYQIAGTAGITVNITPKPLTAVYNGVNKVYDGSTAANATGTSSDIIGGDTVLIRGAGVFTGAGAKNVGTGKAVDITSGSLASTDAGNYTLLNTTGSTTADITPKAITPSYTGGSRVYDGSTAAPVTVAASGFVAGDVITLSETAVFTGAGARNVGSGKAVSVSGISLSGADAGNYSLTTSSATTTGSITPRPLTLTGLTGVTATDRVYDGTRSVAVTVTSTGTIAVDPADVVAGDDVSVTPPLSGLTTGTMVTKSAGSNKPLVVDGLALSGADAGNYTVSAASGVTVNIAPKPVGATYTGVNKVYDGTAAATVVGSSSDLVAGDVVSISGSGLFSAGKNVGTGLAIAVTAGRLSGADASNYSLSATTGSASADITPKSVTASFLGGSRVYDGTTAAPVTGSLSGLISGDTVALGQTATFTGAGAKNVGVNKAVSVTGATLSGTDAGNYSLASATGSTLADVIPRPLGIIGLTGVTATNREYDGTRDVVVTVATTGTVSPDSRDLIAGDDVTISAPPAGVTTGTMADKNVGSLKPVAVAGLALGGADAGNYSVASTSGVTVNITPRTLSPVYTGVSRVYDGTAVATAVGSASGIVAGDSVVITGSGLFTGTGARNVGLGKAVDITTATLSSTDAGNYVLASTTASTTADITPRSVSNTYTGGTRVYDGSTTAPVTRVTSGLITGDAVSVSETATFQGGGAKNVGAAKPVLVSGITLSGDDAANYALITTSAATTGSITPRPLNITGLSGISAVDRVYDGTRDVAVVVSGTVGTVGGDIISGDDVTVNVPGTGLGGGTMADKHVGSNKAVVLSGLSLSGTDAGNYAIAGTAGVTVNITPRALTVAGVSAVDRAYDGTTTVALNTSGGSLTGAVAGDDISLLSTGATGSMADKHVGTGKAVSVTGLALGGADAGNYAATSALGSGLTVNITPRTFNPAATVADRVYNGSTAAAVSLGGDAITGDDVRVSGSGSYADRNAGTGILVSVSGLSLSGTDAGNYTLGGTSLAATGNITRAPMTVAGQTLDKVYGNALTFSGSEFTTTGLVAGETLGGVTLGSAGAAVDAGVTGSPYALTVSGATGGTFNPANYDISYVNGSVTVRPRPLTITGRTVEKVYGNSYTFSGSEFDASGLVTGETLGSVTLASAGAAPSAGVAATPYAVSVSGATGGSFNPVNYDISYVSGAFVVRPRPMTVTGNALEKIYGNALELTGSEFLASGLVTGETVGRVTLSSAGTAGGAGVSATPYAVSVSGATGGSFNPANYDISYVSGQLTVRPRPLTVTSRLVEKIYGNSYTFSGTEFNATGLVTGDTLGSVTLSSGGAAADAPVLGTGYTVNVSGATGGTFNPVNYEVSYVSGQLVVLPRPLTVTTNSLVRYANQSTPVDSLGFGISAGSLVGSDRIGTVAIAVPPGSEGAPGVSYFQLRPTGATFASGSASNYALSFGSGVLLVLPTPPLASESDAGGSDGGGDLAVLLDPAQIRAIQEQRAGIVLRSSTGTNDGLNTTARTSLRPMGTLTPEELNEWLSGDGSKITLPALLKMPLLSMDPALRRLLSGASAATTP